MPIAHTSRIREEIHNLDQNSEVFEEEFDNIAQGHCQNDLFEFELSDQPPRVFVKGNLQRNLEFWKGIGTSKFILNVIERGYIYYHLFVFRSQQNLRTTDLLLTTLNLLRKL